jgi:hypothetical protein
MVAPGGQRLPEFSFYISPINRSSLRMGGETLDLNRLIEPGDIVAVAVRRHPLLLVRWGRLTGPREIKDRSISQGGKTCNAP